tara:strand:+ start:5520 stop:5636 length:117 start_codon:yes stop_codon:yes gene_type:complete
MIMISCGYILDIAKYINAGIIRETPMIIDAWNQCFFLG